MSTNCIRCVQNERTGLDLLCDNCREFRALELERDSLKQELLDKSKECAGWNAKAIDRAHKLHALATELTKEREEIRYQAACSNLWYEKPSAAGTLKAIRIGSSIYEIPNIDPLIEEIVRLKQQLAEAQKWGKELGEAKQAIDTMERQLEGSRADNIALSAVVEKMRDTLKKIAPGLGIETRAMIDAAVLELEFSQLN